MTEDLRRFDAADYLKTPERIAAYLEAAFEDAEDAGDIARALGTVARAIGMTALAERTGLSRQQLYKALSEKGNPTTGTLLSVMRAYGLRLQPVPLAAA